MIRLRSLEQHAPRDICKILVGNKCDMEEEREVDGQEGRNMAEDSGLAFFETSARLGTGVDECFMHLARLVRNRMREQGGLRQSDKRGVVIIGGDGQTPADPQPPCGC